MKNAFSPLEDVNAILLIGKDTFTVERFKELLNTKIRNDIHRMTDEKNRLLFAYYNFGLAFSDELKIWLHNIQFYNSPIDCQLLVVGSQGWQKGKLRVKVEMNLSSSNNETSICIEFCPDEPTTPQSPLDDLRELPEYKQQP